MNFNHRENAEREAKLDLQKPIRQLLDDVHDELLHSDWAPMERLAHASKRIASLNVLIAERNWEVSERQIKAAQDILSASELASQTQQAYAQRAETILTEIRNLGAKMDKRATDSEEAIGRLNKWMLRLTVAAVFFSGIALVISYCSWQYPKSPPEPVKVSASPVH